jgi:hypothetical protein
VVHTPCIQSILRVGPVVYEQNEWNREGSRPTSNIASGRHERSNISAVGFDWNNYRTRRNVIIQRAKLAYWEDGLLTARTSSTTCFLFPSKTTSARSIGLDMLDEWRCRAFGEPRTLCCCCSSAATPSYFVAAATWSTVVVERGRGRKEKRTKRREKKVLNPYMMSVRAQLPSDRR